MRILRNLKPPSSSTAAGFLQPTLTSSYLDTFAKTGPWLLLLFNCFRHAVTRHLGTQHLAQQDLAMADTLDINGMPRPNDITCRYCSRVVPYHICTSTAAGNNGRWVATCNDDHGPNGQPFVHFPAGSRKPTSPPSTPPLAQTATLPDATAPPPMRCGVAGCKQRNLHSKCQRGLCKKDCIAAGGCSVPSHGNRDAFLTAAAATNVAVAQAVAAPPPPVASTSAEAGAAPRYQPQMAPVFTDGVTRRQEEFEKRVKASSATRLNETRASHSVTVYLWAADGEPARSHTFQEGDDEAFIWPHLPLSRALLRPLGIIPADETVLPPPIQKLTEGDIRMWTGINLGHVARVPQPGGKIFLKLASVVDCLDFAALTTPPPPPPHLRNNLPSERSEVRKLMRSVSTPASTHITASSKRSRTVAGLDGSRSPSPVASRERPPIQPAPFKVRGHPTRQPKVESTTALPSAQPRAIQPAPYKVRGMQAMVKVETPVAVKLDSSNVAIQIKNDPTMPLARVKTEPSSLRVKAEPSTIRIKKESSTVRVKQEAPATTVKQESAVRVKQERVVIEILDSDDENTVAPSGTGTSSNPIALDSDSDVPASPILAPTPSDSEYDSDSSSNGDPRAPTPVLLDDGPQWPRDFYACDIVDCLNAMVTKLPNGRTPKPRPIFAAYFPGVPYVRQTISDQRKRFKLLPHDKQQAAINAKHTDSGLWSEVMEDAPSLRRATRVGRGKGKVTGRANEKKRLRVVKEEIEID